jgi:hypothetical protein
LFAGEAAGWFINEVEGAEVGVVGVDEHVGGATV